MHEPEHLVLVGDKVGWKFQRDDLVHRIAIELVQIQEPASQHLIHDALGRVGLERDGDNVSLMAMLAQRITQGSSQHLGSALNERNLNGRDDYSHGLSRSQPDPTRVSNALSRSSKRQ